MFHSYTPDSHIGGQIITFFCEESVCKNIPNSLKSLGMEWSENLFFAAPPSRCRPPHRQLMVQNRFVYGAERER